MPEFGVGYQIVMDITTQCLWLSNSFFMSGNLVGALFACQAYICGTFKSDTREMPFSVMQPGISSKGKCNAPERQHSG